MNNARDMIGSVTISLGALALVGAIIWQVVHDKSVDVYIGTLAGTLFGAFLRTPGTTENVQIKQPVDRPVPTQEVP